MIKCNIGYGPWCRDCETAPACPVKATTSAGSSEIHGSMRKMIFDEAAQDMIHCECFDNCILRSTKRGEIYIDVEDPRIAYYDPQEISRGFAEVDFTVELQELGVDCTPFVRKRMGAGGERHGRAINPN